MIQRDATTGEFVFHYSDTDEVVSSLKEIFNDTEIGQQYISGDYVTKDGTNGYDQIVQAAVKIAGGGPMLTIDILARALELLIDSGELRPKNAAKAKQLEEPEEDLRPRDRNGKLLTPAQIKWSEYRQFVESGGQRFNQRTGQFEATGQPASTDEINRRKQSDPEFRQYVVSSLRNELLPAQDGVTPLGQSQNKTRVSADLVEFARKYRKEPVDNLRPRGGFVTLEGEQIPWSEFQNLMNKATAAGVI
jgi:hypothetical protein